MKNMCSPIEMPASGSHPRNATRDDVYTWLPFASLALPDAGQPDFHHGNSQRPLIISSRYLGYETGGLRIQTAWENIQSVNNGIIGPYLLLKKSAVIDPAPVSHPHPHVEGRMIPLLPFGCPSNVDLMADLKRFVPAGIRKRL